MTRTYQCNLCGEKVKQSAIPQIIAKEQLCVECYKTKYSAFGNALKAVIRK